ncbi:MAG: hypothetical protein HY916_11380 [Desulfovibrio sp.]|jgi:hypothetical protein|nr:hypothetical protein [Desulfovibrio sp.]
MSSLRDNLETTFAAAAFGERGLHQHARDLCRETRAQETSPAKSKGKAARPRPTLNA